VNESESEELDKVIRNSTVYVWYYQSENILNRLCKIIKEKHNDTEKQNLFGDVIDSISWKFIMG
jgi:spore coat polysaccharide biosynthesis protein SpsF (cytidylyltransferase family)